jgi:hypothetical protein
VATETGTNVAISLHMEGWMHMSSTISGLQR